MAIETDADRAVFVEADDFGVAINWVSAGGTATLEAVLDAEYLLLTTELDPAGQEGVTPAITCRSSDVPADAAHGDTLAVSGAPDAAFDGDYTVVELKPDGTGMTVVRMQEA